MKTCEFWCSLCSLNKSSEARNIHHASLYSSWHTIETILSQCVVSQCPYCPYECPNSCTRSTDSWPRELIETHTRYGWCNFYTFYHLPGKPRKSTSSTIWSIIHVISFIHDQSAKKGRPCCDALIRCSACWDMLTWSKMVLFYLSKYIHMVHPLTAHVYN